MLWSLFCWTCYPFTITRSTIKLCTVHSLNSALLINLGNIDFEKNWKSRESNLGPRGEKQESVITPSKKARKTTLWNIGLSEMEGPRFESCWVETTDDDDEHQRSDKFLKNVFIVKWMASVTFDCHQTYFWLWKIFIASLTYENG